MALEKRWLIEETDSDIVNQLSQSLKINKNLCHLLVARGIKTFEEARDFFRPTYSLLHDPYLMKDMDKAIERIKKAISNNEKILVFGDYDVDGTTAVSLVYSFLQSIYSNIGYYIPDRYKEGYGISFAGIDYGEENNFGLIIALDCGIKSNDKIDYANNKNIDFIICDHHLPGDELPNAVAVLDQKRADCNYPYKELSGCGIGFKLIQALAKVYNVDEKKVYAYLDLVAISIASDIVPITGENRVLTFFGLQYINEKPRPGIEALINIALNKDGEIQTSRKRLLETMDLVFIIGPRINAAGRIGHGSQAVELLVESDPTKAQEMAKNIQINNQTRKEHDKDITEEAMEMVAKDPLLIAKKSTVLFQPHWHKGVIGIVASRLIETYYKPTIVLTESNGSATGSARSVYGFDVHAAISACSDLLEQFGGHKYAAGLSMKLENLPKFIEKFETIVASTITDDQLIPKIDIDAEIELADINAKFLNIIEQMGPFGPGNMRPVFVTRGVNDTGRTRLVKEEHLKLDIEKNGQNSIGGIGFNMKAYFDYISKKPIFDVCYQLYENDWQGRKNVEIRLKDLK
jgi:single-stranded-DNA-specific exonuclease